MWGVLATRGGAQGRPGAYLLAVGALSPARGQSGAGSRRAFGRTGRPGARTGKAARAGNERGWFAAGIVRSTDRGRTAHRGAAGSCVPRARPLLRRGMARLEALASAALGPTVCGVDAARARAHSVGPIGGGVGNRPAYGAFQRTAHRRELVSQDRARRPARFTRR